MKQPLDMSIGQRLAISFALLLLVVAVFIGFIVSEQARSARVQMALSEHIIPLGQQINLLKRELYHLAVDLHAYVLRPAPDRLERYRNSVDEVRGVLRRLREQWRASDGETTFERLESAVTRYLAEANALAAQRASRSTSAADEEAVAEFREAALAVTHDFVVRQDAQIEAGLNAMGSVRADVSDGLLAGSGLIALFLVVVGYFTAQSIRRPTRELIQVAKALEAGDWRPALAWAPGHGDPGRHAPRSEILQLGRAFGAAAAAVESREQWMGAADEVVAATASSLKKAEIAAAALPGIVAHARAEVGVVYRHHPDAGELIPIARHGLNGDVERLQVGEGVPGQAAKEGRSIVVRDIPRDAGFTVKLGYDQAPPKTVAAVPIRFGREVRGVLLVASLRDIDGDALSFLEAAGLQLGVGFKNARAHEETERLLAEVREHSELVQAQNEELQAQSEELQAQSEEIQAQNESLRQQAEELRAHAAAIAEAGERKSEFLGVLAHELRNPLAAITNSLVIAKRTAPGSEQSARAQAVIERQAQQLVRLIDDLLDITRISQGKIQIQRERLDLVEVVRTCIEDQAAELDANELTVELDLPDADVWVEGDRARVCQILGNLLNNAVKFSDRGQQIGVAVRPHARTDQVALHVIDRGIGIETALLPRLFQSFNQGVIAPGRTNTGLGLGLALVKELTELHGGSVEARSEGPGRGAEFVVWLPLAQAQAVPAARSQTVRGAGRRILLIEDNVDVAHTLRDVLLLEGHEVELAHSGEEALQRARRFLPEVVLCDIGLPEMDGYEVARRLGADANLRPALLIALTGYTSQIDKDRAALAGFDFHLAKPPSVESIRAALASLESP